MIGSESLVRSVDAQNSYQGFCSEPPESKVLNAKEELALQVQARLKESATNEKKALLENTKHHRKMIMDKVRDSCRKSLLDDPDMPDFVKNGIGAAFDNVWVDIEHECERTLRQAVLTTIDDEADVKGPSGEGFFGLWCEFRSFVLAHYFPWNKTIYGKWKDPVYVFIYLLTLIPWHGLRTTVFSVVLGMLCVEKPDEYQLVNFIILFKGMQFLTSGMISLVVGAAEYYSCYTWHKDSMAHCVETEGPSGKESFGQVFDYLGNIALVWVAFYMLHRHHTHTLDVETAESEDGLKSISAGKRLRTMMLYDIICFLVSLSSFFILTLHTGGMEASSSQVRANIFWCCVLYSILSLPFSFFLLPGFQTLLIHHEATGFNEHGACIKFKLPTTEDAEELIDINPRTVRVLGMLNKVFSYAEAGGEQRGGAKGQYMLGDITRGIWEKHVGRNVKNIVTQFRGSSASDNKEHELPPLQIASIEIPAVGIRRIKDPMKLGQETAHYRVDVVLQEGEGEEASWCVYHRFDHFKQLFVSLGKPDYPEAPFPESSFWNKDKVEIRRQALEPWLAKVVQDSRSQAAPWTGAIRRFFDRKHSVADETPNPGESHNPGEPQNLAESFMDSETSGRPPGMSEGTVLCDEVERYDFGPSISAHFCSQCRKMTRNRGCKECVLVFCQACYRTHLTTYHGQDASQDAEASEAPVTDALSEDDITRDINANTDVPEPQHPLAASEDEDNVETQVPTDRLVIAAGKESPISSPRNARSLSPSNKDVKPLQITAVNIEGIDQRGSKTFFTVIVRVHMEDLDMTKKIQVSRKYNDFQTLMKRLDLEAKSYPHAPFPAKRNVMASKQLFNESRRHALEKWIQYVVEDPRSKSSPQAGHIRRFFDPSGWDDTENADIEGNGRPVALTADDGVFDES